LWMSEIKEKWANTHQSQSIYIYCKIEINSTQLIVITSRSSTKVLRVVVLRVTALNDSSYVRTIQFPPMFASYFLPFFSSLLIHTRSQYPSDAIQLDTNLYILYIVFKLTECLVPAFPCRIISYCFCGT
jgi:hypothetical protein